MLTIKDLESYLKIKEFMRENNLNEIDVIESIKDTSYVPLIVESKGEEPKKFYCLAAAAGEIGVLWQIIYYAHINKKSRITRRKGGLKIFTITWLDYSLKSKDFKFTGFLERIAPRFLELPQ